MLTTVRARRTQTAPKPLDASTMDISAKRYMMVGVAVEGNEQDEQTIRQALSLGGTGATIVLVHIVGSPIGLFHREQSRDTAARSGEEYVASLRKQLATNTPFNIKTVIGFGLPPKELVRIAKQEHFDILVMRSHGHRGLKDIFFGATISPVRHQLSIPLFIVK